MRLLLDKSFHPQRVLPMRALLLALALALGLSYWLVPEQNELVERLIKDHQYARLQQTFISIGSSIDPGELRRLSREELTSLATMARLTPRERLNSIFSSNAARYNRFVHAMALTDMRYVDVIKPADAWQLVKNHRASITDEQLIEIGTMLAHNAIAVANPGLAVDIFSLICELPASTARHAQELAVFSRWAAKPLDGALRLRTWLQKRPAPLSVSEHSFLSELGSTLALEGGKVSLALDYTIDELQRFEPGKLLPAAILEKAQHFASQCNRTNDLLPWFRRYLASLPESRMSMSELHVAHQRPGTTKEYARYLLHLANAADWGSDFEAAFDHHLRLALLDRLESLDRCVALSDFLGRDEETVEALLLLDPIQERPQLRLKLADKLASLGRDDEAHPLYEAWLKEHPNDRDVAYALACLLEDEGKEDKATAAFESIAREHPEDVPVLKKLAECYIRGDRHRDALKLYQSLREKDHDHYTRENFAMLAESLDDHATLFSAQLLIARDSSSTEAWLDIAETASYLKDKAPALAAMQEGLQKNPGSHGLRLAISQIHSDAGRFDEAVAVLLHESVRRNQPAVEALLHLVEETREHDKMLTFVGNDVEKRFPLSVSARLDLAMLCYFGHESERAEALFASVPATRENFIAIAEARYATGSFELAEKQMNSYLKDNPSAAPDDWVFLGDIYDAMGREEDARRAYHQSLSLLTADLSASRTTSSLTRPLPKPTPPTP